VGEPEAYWDGPMASLVLHVNREALHHLVEVRPGWKLPHRAEQPASQ
jgi:hypothetical protein